MTIDTYGHLIPGGEAEGRDRIESYLERAEGMRGLRAV
jgi:hypothetical protein